MILTVFLINIVAPPKLKYVAIFYKKGDLFVNSDDKIAMKARRIFILTGRGHSSIIDQLKSRYESQMRKDHLFSSLDELL